MSVMMKSKQKAKPHQGETLLLNTWKNRSLLAMAIPVIVLQSLSRVSFNETLSRQ